MNLLADATALAWAVDSLARVVPAKCLHPILGTLVLIADNDRLVLYATNLDCLVAIVVPAKIIKGGAAAIEAGRLIAFAENLKGEVEIEVSTSRATLKAGRRQANLAVLPPDDFPEMPFDGEGKCSFDLPATETAILSDITFAASTDQNRPYLSGAHLFSRKKKLSLEAGTATMFAQFNTKIAANIPADWSLIVPRETLPLLKQLFPEGCKLSFTQSKMQADGGAVRLISKLVNGPYPPTEKIIPAAAETLVISADAGELAAAANRVTAIAGMSRDWITLFPRGDHLLLKASDKAEAEDAIAAECSGTLEQCTVSAKWFCGLLAGLDVKTVRLTQAERGKPIRFDPVGKADRLGVVMPVHFSAEVKEREAA